jgi:hypothetical protein
MTDKELKITDPTQYQGLPIPPRRRRREAPINYDNTPVLVRGEALSPIWWRGRQWAVTSMGIERLDGTYFIAEQRLAEAIDEYGWPEHVGQKAWVDIDDFCTAWLVAIALHGVDVTAQKARAAISRSPPPESR